MKRILTMAFISLLTISVSVNLAGCCDKDKEPPQENPSDDPNDDPENPSEGLVEKTSKNLTAMAFNLDRKEESKGSSANFDLTKNTGIIIIKGSYNEINIGSAPEYKQSYSYTYTITPNQMVAKPGDEVEIIYTPANQESEAVFSIEGGESYKVGIENPTIKFKLPSSLPDKTVIKGEASYIEGDTRYIRTGEVEILSEEIIIYENIKYEDMTIPVGASFVIPFSTGVKWTSSNSSIASVNNSTVIGKSEGEVTISSDKHSFKVKVKGSIISDYQYMEPCIDWGSNINTVKSFMTGFEIESETVEGNTTKLEYAIKELTSYTYEFENGGLSSAIVLHGTLDPQKFLDYLNKQYIDAKIEEGGMHLYFTKDYKTAVGVQPVFDYIYTLVYMPVDDILAKKGAKTIVGNLNKKSIVSDKKIQTLNQIKK